MCHPHTLGHCAGSDTRNRILDLAEVGILEKGFAATSIDELIAAVGITKNGFFDHFRDKSELAKARLVRYVQREDTLFDDLFRRADELDDDPLHGFLVGLRMMSDLPAGHPSCLVAAYCYQDRLFDREVRGLYTSAMLGWRRRFRERLNRIAVRYPMRITVDLDHLADMLSAIAEGGVVVSKVVRDKKALSQQRVLYREFVRAVFLGV